MTSAISIQVEPTDNGLAVLNAIKGAKKSVHMTMYLLSNNQVINALIDLKKAGKDVKVVLNKNFPANAGSNQSTYDTLKAAGVSVVWAPAGYQYTHAKTVILDGTSVLIMTMNLTYTSASQNREYIVTDTDPQDIADAEMIFQGDYTNAATTVNGKLVLSPKSTSSIDARARLKALIDGATKTLDVEGETLSDDALVDAMILAHQQNVAVRIVVDGSQDPTPAQADSIALLKAANVPVVSVKAPTIHAKAIVADGVRGYVGSQNFTTNSLFNNREIGVLTDAASELAKVTTAISQDFAAGSPL